MKAIELICYNLFKYQYNHERIHPSGQNTIGFQNKESFSHEAVNKNPFDAALFTDSTIGRLEFAINWEKYTSLPYFWNNKTLGRIFGFTCPEYQDLFSKLLS